MKKFRSYNYLLLVILCISIITILSVLLTGCRQQNNGPFVNPIIELKNITDEEYEEISRNLPKLDRQNLKKLFIQVDISNAKKCKTRDINIPDLYAIDSFDKVRSLLGGGSEINNLKKESSAQAVKYLIFDSAGMTLNNIKEIYSGKIIKVEIITPDNIRLEYNYDIGKLLTEK